MVAPRALIATTLENLDPAWFAFVMATGILGLAAQTIGIAYGVRLSAAITVPAYGILGILTAVRVLRYRMAVARDFRGPRSTGFAAVVAGTCVLGAEARLIGAAAAAGALWIGAAALWCLVTAELLVLPAVRGQKSGLEESAGGAALLLVVATQAVVVLQMLLVPGDRSLRHPAVPFAFGLGWFVLGCVLYTVMIVPIVRRLRAIRGPGEFAPSYWIAMGALAISTLAASLLTDRAAGSADLRGVAPVVAGTAVLCWIAATAWIPVLTVFMLRWHAAHRGRLPMPQYWAFVFPLGMYAAATHALAATVRMRVLDAVPPVFVAAGLVAWLAGAVDLLQRFAGAVRHGRRTRATP